MYSESYAQIIMSITSKHLFCFHNSLTKTKEIIKNKNKCVNSRQTVRHTHIYKLAGRASSQPHTHTHTHTNTHTHTHQHKHTHTHTHKHTHLHTHTHTYTHTLTHTCTPTPINNTKRCARWFLYTY